MSGQASRGYAYSLALLPWDVFATLTFKNPLPCERRAWRLAWRHFHMLSDSLGRPYSALLLALRSERGEIGDRFHFHYLLGGTGASNPNSLAFWLAHQWKALTGGHAEIRPYNRSLAGADYIEGCLSGANSYEVGKFNRADRLELSVSVFRRVNWNLRRGSQRECDGKGVSSNTGLRANTENDCGGSTLNVKSRPAAAAGRMLPSTLPGLSHCSTMGIVKQITLSGVLIDDSARACKRDHSGGMGMGA